MSNDINVYTATGRLGADPELRYFPNGGAFLNLSVAVGRSWKDAGTGEKKSATLWMPVILTEKQAEAVAKLAKKGRRVAFSGELVTRKWQDQGGNDRYTTECRANRFQFMDYVEDGAAPAASAAPSSRQPSQRDTRAASTRQPAPPNHGGFDDDDIPFD